MALNQGDLQRTERRTWRRAGLHPTDLREEPAEPAFNGIHPDPEDWLALRAEGGPRNLGLDLDKGRGYLGEVEATEKIVGLSSRWWRLEG